MSSSSHKQQIDNSLSHKKSKSYSSSMYHIPEFVIVPKQLIFRPYLLISRSSHSRILKIVLPLLARKKTLYR